MTTEKDKGTNKRVKLEITEVSEPKDIGKDRPFMMLEFKAKGEDDDKAHTYKAFSSRLFEYIEKGATIDCDINITTKTVEGQDEEPRTYTNRKVTQIYVDGQPVNVRQSGGGYRQDSPETRASIESQKRADITAQLWIGGKFDEKTPEVIKMRKWLMAETPLPDKAPEAPQTALKPQETAPKENLKDLPIKNLGDLFSACLKHYKLSQSAVLKELGGGTKEDIADAQTAWLQIVENRQSPF